MPMNIPPQNSVAGGYTAINPYAGVNNSIAGGSNLSIAGGNNANAGGVNNSIAGGYNPGGVQQDTGTSQIFDMLFSIVSLLSNMLPAILGGGQGQQYPGPQAQPAGGTFPVGQVPPGLSPYQLAAASGPQASVAGAGGIGSPGIGASPLGMPQSAPSPMVAPMLPPVATQPQFAAQPSLQTAGGQPNPLFSVTTSINGDPNFARFVLGGGQAGAPQVPGQMPPLMQQALGMPSIPQLGSPFGGGLQTAGSPAAAFGAPQAFPASPFSQGVAFQGFPQTGFPQQQASPFGFPTAGAPQGFALIPNNPGQQAFALIPNGPSAGFASQGFPSFPGGNPQQAFAAQQVLQQQAAQQANLAQQAFQQQTILQEPILQQQQQQALFQQQQQLASQPAQAAAVAGGFPSTQLFGQFPGMSQQAFGVSPLNNVAGFAPTQLFGTFAGMSQPSFGATLPPFAAGAATAGGVNPNFLAAGSFGTPVFMGGTATTPPLFAGLGISV